MLTITHTLTLSRTCDALAVREVHALHAHGKVQMGDVTCEKRGESDAEGERKKRERRRK